MFEASWMSLSIWATVSEPVWRLACKVAKGNLKRFSDAHALLDFLLQQGLVEAHSHHWNRCFGGLIHFVLPHHSILELWLDFPVDVNSLYNGHVISISNLIFFGGHARLEPPWRHFLHSELGRRSCLRWFSHRRLLLFFFQFLSSSLDFRLVSITFCSWWWTSFHHFWPCAGLICFNSSTVIWVFQLLLCCWFPVSFAWPLRHLPCD